MTPLTQLVATVLELPAADVGDDVGPATHDSWTSLRHFQLVVAVEETFGISLSRAEIRSVRTVGDLRRLIAGKGGTP
jgi:acyl carrier protein